MEDAAKQITEFKTRGCLLSVKCTPQAHCGWAVLKVCKRGLEMIIGGVVWWWVGLPG